MVNALPLKMGSLKYSTWHIPHKAGVVPKENAHYKRSWKAGSPGSITVKPPFGTHVSCSTTS